MKPGVQLPLEVADRGMKTFFRGTHRLTAPEQTLRSVRGLMPVMGITRIANVTGLDTIGIPVVTVTRPNSRSIAVSQGKGLDIELAKASGLMESVEAYHAEHITLPLKLASYEELRYTHCVVDVDKLPKPTGSLFHPNLRLLWIEGYDLLQRERVWLPYEMVHLNYTLPLPPGSGCFAASSSGLASGNHLFEAISHGLCELVERDAAALWLLRSAQSRLASRIELSSVNDSECRELLHKYDKAGVRVGVWEITSDFRISAFLCVISEITANPLRPLPPSTGYGCHPARPIALVRALTEAAQCRLTCITGSRDDVYRRDLERLRRSDLLHRDHQLLEVYGPLRAFDDGPTWDGVSFEDDLIWELERLRAAGIASAIVIDLTKPEFRVPVVRVVVPGLEAKETANYGHRARALLQKTV